jgi:hypothetical protein
MADRRKHLSLSPARVASAQSHPWTNGNPKGKVLCSGAEDIARARLSFTSVGVAWIRSLLSYSFTCVQAHAQDLSLAETVSTVG